MTLRRLIFITSVVCLALSAKAQTSQALKLWYNQPATQWEEALPLGNGRLGAMVYGGPVHDEIQLNEENIWGGSPHNNTNPAAKNALPEIRKLIFDGRNREAQQLCGKTISSPHSQGMPYQTVGSLILDFENIGEVTDYYRELSLDKALCTTRFRSNGVSYTREAFTSFPDQLLIIRLTASQKGKLSFTARYTSPFNKDALQTGVTKDQLLQLNGQASSHEGIPGKIRFTALTKASLQGGKLSVQGDTALQIRNAQSVTLYVSVGTNFVNYQDLSGHPEQQARSFLKNAGKNYAKAKAAHQAAYAQYFNRVKLDLGSNSQVQKPTDQRIREFASTFDPQLATLYFQFGRYLLICSSQPGGQAANLQGIWNNKTFAPWDGKYTTNINVEMNYWPAETTNLTEMHEPFLRLIKQCALQGQQSGKMYGCRGWTLHHNTDIWRTTGSVDSPWSGIWPTCNAWFCQHLWDHYLFSGNQNYLKEVYPILKGACQFYLDFLVREPKNQWLVAAPSYSPENAPKVNGKHDFVVVAGATMDNQMISDLFHNTIEATAVVGEDSLFVDSLKQVVAQLAPMQIGRWGQLQEWLDDWDDPNDRHRHISHLWGLYPGRQINLYTTPLLQQAAIRSLINRGDHSTGWSMGWKVCCWARLLDGNHAYKLIQEQISPVTSGGGGGTYPNLFDAHPPFQIDGNFGCTAGFAEMFVQSHAGAIHLLPALPEVWSRGNIQGLRCRGGFIIRNMEWDNEKITRLTIESTLGGTLRLRSAVSLRLNNTPLTPTTQEESNNPLLRTQPIRKPLISPQAPISTPEQPATILYDISTEAGKLYTFRS